MTEAFAELDRTLARVVAAHHGVRPIEQGEGDSFVIAFGRASDAVACALALQRAPSHRSDCVSVCTPEKFSCVTRPITSAPPSIAPHASRPRPRRTDRVVRYHDRFGVRQAPR